MAKTENPVRDSICMVIGHQTYVDKDGPTILFHAQPSNWGGIVEFMQRQGYEPKAYPEGALLHIRSDKAYGLNSPDEILQVTLPQEAHVTKKLGGGNWRAQNDQTGNQFDFSEKGDRFLPAGGDWPKVGLAITYHQTPSEHFAIMAKQKMQLFVASGRYNIFLPHDTPIPTPEQLKTMDVNASAERDRANNSPLAIAGAIFGAAVMAASPLLELGLKATVARHKLKPRHDFYLPEGYGQKRSGGLAL